MQKLLVLVLLTVSCGPQVSQREGAPAHAKVVTRDSLGTATTVLLPMPPSGNGDWNNGYGTYVYKHADGSWRVLSTSWREQYVLEYKLPDSLSGTATFVKNYGWLEMPGQQFGVYYDAATNRICGSGGGTYDADPSTTATVACAEIDSKTGKFPTYVGTDGKTHTSRRVWVFSEAKQGCLSLPAPAGTDVAANTVRFTVTTGLTKGRMITVKTTGGGLLQSGYYYVGTKATNTFSFHRTVPDAQNGVNAVDLTAVITSEFVSCVPRGDRRTMGGITDIPPDLQAAFRGTIAVGFGGYQSIQTSGNQSAGPTACTATLPAQDYYGFVPCTPMLGYAHTGQAGGCATFANRDSRYTDVIAWEDCPEKGTDAVTAYGHGKWATGDTIGQSAYFLSSPPYWSFGVLADQLQGCVYYGDNVANRWPLTRESGGLRPLSTSTSLGTVTMPTSVVWADGTMVAPVKNGEGGLSTESAYFTRKPTGTTGNVYALKRTLAEAQGRAGPTPVATDTVKNRVGFTDPHGFSTKMAVHVDQTGGGLTAGTTYYVNAANPTILTFHKTAADAEGANLGQSDAKALDLTAPITAAVIANTPLKISAPLVSGLRLVSYCARTGGAKASLNSQGARHVMYGYNPADLQAVIEGQRVENQQPVSYADFPIPGIAYGEFGVQGMPSMGRRILGVMWVPERERLAVQVGDTAGTKQGRRVHFFPLLPAQ